MDQVVANPPRGLISLFGLREMGAAPNLLSQNILATFDIAELSLLNRELITGTTNTGGVGGYQNVAVPAGELWYVWSYSVTTPVIGAGESIRFSLGYVTTAASAIITASDPRTAIVNELAAAFIQNPFWLGPGSGLGHLVEAEVGAAKAMAWRAVIVRLRI